MRPSSNVRAALALAAMALLGGCSEYLDRRDQIALGAGNAVHTDKVTMMVDPWPRASANRDLAFDGAKMQTAVERYKTNRVFQPKGTGTSGAYDSGGAQTPQSNASPVGPPLIQPAGSVK